MGLPRYPICSAVSWDGVCVGLPAVWDAACSLLCRCLAKLHNPSAFRTRLGKVQGHRSHSVPFMTWNWFWGFLCCSFQQGDVCYFGSISYENVVDVLICRMMLLLQFEISLNLEEPVVKSFGGYIRQTGNKPLIKLAVLIRSPNKATLITKLTETRQE